MTEEEKKAIENFDKRLTIEKYTNNIGTPVYIEDIATILNLIQKQQAEIQSLKQAGEATEKVYKAELEKKDKIIDEMANNLERCMETNIYDFLDICNKCKSNNEDCHGDYCKDTIKQYFERKVEEK